MPEFAKSYHFGGVTETPTIDGQEIPWYIAASPMPMVAAHEDSQVHILWLPVLIDAPLPERGTPEGESLFTGPLSDFKRDGDED